MVKAVRSRFPRPAQGHREEKVLEGTIMEEPKTVQETWDRAISRSKEMAPRMTPEELEADSLRRQQQFLAMRGWDKEPRKEVWRKY